MAQLENVRHEMFCRYMCSGMPQAEAYDKAGDERSSANASVLARKPFIKVRIDELVAEKLAREGHETVGALERFDLARDEVETTGTVRKEWVLQELIENAKMAREAKQFAASNSALQLLGKELGMFADKVIPAGEKERAPGEGQHAIPVDRVNDLLGKLGFQGQIDMHTLEPIKVAAKRLSKDKVDADS